MKITLDNIESAFPEDLIVRGEEIIDKEGNIEFHESEKNLWLTIINGQEVELKLRGNTVVSFTCECGEFSKEKICPHVVAGLLTFRKTKKKSEKKPVAKPAPKSKSKRLTVASILDSINQEQLIEFVSEYARRDQQFTNALKARFAASVEHIDLEEKYDTLLRTLIRSNQAANLAIARHGAKKIHDTLTLLLSQAERELVQGHFAEAFEAARQIIEKITPVLSRLTAHRNEVQSNVELAYKLLHHISEARIPPPMRLQMGEFAARVIDNRHFNFPKIEQLFLHWLLKISSEEQVAEIILSTLDKTLDRPFHNKEVETKLQLYQASIIEKTGTAKEKNKYLQGLESRSLMFISIVETAFDWSQFSVARWIAEGGLVLLKNAAVAERLEEILLQLAIKEDKPQEQVKYAASRFMRTFELQYFELFKQAAGSKEVGKLISRLEKLGVDTDKPDVMAAIYTKEHQYDKLFRLIEEKGSIDLFLKYCKPLHDHDPRRLEQFSWTLIEEYLDSHLGLPPSLRMRNLIRQLIVSDLKGLAKSLLDKIRKKYGYRNSLSEELDIFSL